MKNILITFLTIFLASCATTPYVQIERYTPSSGKIDLNAAIIISDHLRNSIWETIVYTPCRKEAKPGSRSKEMFPVDKDGMIMAKNAAGKAMEELFVEGLPYLFKKVDVYRDISEIKDKENYDYILFPNVSIETSYDSEKALKREIHPPFTKKWREKTLLEISANAELQLQVENIKNKKVVGVFDSHSKALGNSYAEHCSDWLSHYSSTLSDDYSRVIGKAMSEAFKELLKTTEAGLHPLSQAKAEERALPSDLSLNVRFSDTSAYFPNNSLDAGEDAEMMVTIKNTGKGTGYGTNLEIVSDNSKITYEKEIKVGDIQPNETKEIKVPLKASLDISDGKTSFQFNLKEKRGYDAKKVVMNVPTAKMEKPELEIVSTEINDGDTGLAKGNGNGIPESGETIELTAFIKNQGIGKAIGVNLNGENITSGIQWVRDSILVGTIPSGEIAKAKIAFTIPRNFDAKEISTSLNANDMRGVSKAEKQVAISYAKRSPNLQYAYRIYSKGNLVNTITNGEDYEIELTLSNSGQIPAKDVVIMIKEGLGGLSLSRSKIDIGEIKEQASISGQRFTLSVPRTFVETQVPLNIEIAQADFSSVRSSLQIPVDVKSPKLKYVANLLSKSGGNIPEQGESAILEIHVLNEGNLPAEGVKVKIESKDENLRIIGQTEALVGKIPAFSKSETIKFQVSTFRRIKIGDTYLGVNITQNDFSPVVSQYAINIREEGLTVVDVAAEDRIKPVAGTGARTQIGPTINLKTPQNAETTGDETIRLAFEVADTRNIDTVKVDVNGIAIPLDEKAGLTIQPSKRKEILKNIPLKEGDNKIVITAYNSDNIPTRKELIVTRIAEDDVDTPPITNIRNPDAMAVVIGISKYENRDIPSVDYARRDAMTMKEYLIRTLGFDEKRIIEAYNEGARLDKLNSIFRTKLKNMVIPNKSDVFIFYSGHGVPDVNTKEAYFVPYGFDPGDVENTGYILKDLYQQLVKINAKSVTVVIDACFSGSSEKGSIIKDISPVFLDVSNPMLKVKNGVIFTASSSKQVSSWYHKKQHGLFTYYYLQGLRGKADTDNDGKVTVNELGEYVKRNVSEQARFLNREQTPDVIGDKDTVVVRYK